MNLNTGKP